MLNFDLCLVSAAPFALSRLNRSKLIIMAQENIEVLFLIDLIRNTSYLSEQAHPN